MPHHPATDPAIDLAVIGAGPIGLAAAAHARARGLSVVVLEAGSRAGSGVREWGHVRLFSPWSELTDTAAVELLEASGWAPPAADRYPTGAEWADLYLQPLADALAATPDVEIRYGDRVIGVSRLGRDRLVDSGRESEPFVLQVASPGGTSRLTAAAVLDASGTWGTPNPLGGDGLSALGEPQHADRISYRIPDLSTQAGRLRYAGKHIVVAGTGASAQNTLVSLVRLAEQEPGTRVSWLVRRSNVGHAFGGGDNDQLVARGALGKAAEQAVSTGVVRTVAGFRAAEVIAQADGRLRVVGVDGREVADVDQIVAVTGFRPDLSMLSEIRLDLDPVLQAPRALAPLIDPNVHSCGTVYPHGAHELAQPEAGFYLVGMKSYGRAPSFLTLTGCEQVRSVVAAIAGDHEAAARVELVLPETGVCGGAGGFDSPTAVGAGCCAPAGEPDLLTIGGLGRG